MVLEFLVGLVYGFGYLGVFLGSLIGSATIFLPVPSFLIVFVAGKVLNPLAVGILAGIGAALGELTSYFIGRGLHYSKKRLSKKGEPRKKLAGKSKKDLTKNSRWIERFNSWFHRRYGFALIILFAATPLPDDILGIYCGMIRYGWKKFFFASLIGKLILCIIISYAGFYGLTAVSSYLA